MHGMNQSVNKIVGSSWKFRGLIFRKFQFRNRANVVVHLDDLFKLLISISLLKSLQNVNLKVALRIEFGVNRLTLDLTSLTVTSSSAHK